MPDAWRRGSELSRGLRIRLFPCPGRLPPDILSVSTGWISSQGAVAPAPPTRFPHAAPNQYACESFRPLAILGMCERPHEFPVSRFNANAQGHSTTQENPWAP